MDSGLAAARRPGMTMMGQRDQISVLFPAPGGRAVGLVLEDEPLSEELRADAIGIGKAALLAGAGALGDARLDPGRLCIRRAAQPGGGIAFQDAHQHAGGAQLSLKPAALGIVCGAVDRTGKFVQLGDGERRVEVVFERVAHGAGYGYGCLSGTVTRQVERAVEAVEGGAGLRKFLRGPVERVAVMRREKSEADRLARRLREDEVG